MFEKNQIDRPFLEKFNNSTFFKNTEELNNSISVEIANILSANIRICGNLNKVPSTEVNPYAYGIRDLQSILDAREMRTAFVEHCKQQILNLEPRINNIEISNVALDQKKQFVLFDITYTLNKSNCSISTTISVKS